MQRPQLWLLAGGSGAGKTTFYEQTLAKHGIVFVNADVIARTLYPENPEVFSYQAAREAQSIRSRYLQERRTFCFETVFSHPSKIDFVAQAKSTNYEIILVFIHLAFVELNCARVAQRVSSGGHGVAQNKIEERIPRLLKNIRTAIPLCDEVRLLDNSSAEVPYSRVATLLDGFWRKHLEPLPDWAEYLVGGR